MTQHPRRQLFSYLPPGELEVSSIPVFVEVLLNFKRRVKLPKTLNAYSRLEVMFEDKPEYGTYQTPHLETPGVAATFHW
jgi:hypothetical protein